jgi:hypothetical protein
LILKKEAGAMLALTQEAVKEYKQSKLDSEGLAFFLKLSIFSFVGFVEGLSFSMRNGVNLLGGLAGVELTERERAKLMERRYDKEKDKVTHILAKDSVNKNLGRAFRYYCQVYDVASPLDTNTAGYANFLDLLKCRHQITHPAYLEDVMPVGMLGVYNSAAAWFSEVVMELYTRCCQSAGVDIGKSGPYMTETVARQKPHPDAIAPEGFYELELHKSGLRTLKYLEVMIGVLTRDIGRALELNQTSSPNFKDPIHPFQMRFRGIVRVAFAATEGVAFALRFFILSAQDRDEIALSEQDRFDLENQEKDIPALRLHRAATMFSREFGEKRVLMWKSGPWLALRRTTKLRDRFMHPRYKHDIVISIKEIKLIIEALGAIGEALGALKLGEHWARMAADGQRF